MSNKIKLGLIAALVAGLVGCGSDSDDSGGIGGSGSYAQNGLYQNDDDGVLMLVDMSRVKNKIIVGDFGNDAIIAAHSATKSGDAISIEGLTYVDYNAWIDDEDLTLNASFSSQGAQVSGVIDGQSHLYSFKKAAPTLPLADIVGTFTNLNDGTRWTVNSSGSFEILAAPGVDCLIQGSLIPRLLDGLYFTATAAATSCADSNFNGIYEGIVVTATHSGNTYIAGVLSNDNGILWGSAPLN